MGAGFRGGRSESDDRWDHGALRASEFRGARPRRTGTRVARVRRGQELGGRRQLRREGHGDREGRAEGVQRLLRDAEERKFDHLVVWALDRFSREETFTKATQAILDLEGLGIRFHSLKEPMLDTPEDGKPNLGRDVLLALLPVIASFESKRRSERVRVAMREIKEGRRRTRSGRPPGRPVRATPEKVSAIVRLKAQGLTWRVIAQRVGLPRGTCANVASRSGGGCYTTRSLQKGLPGLRLTRPLRKVPVDGGRAGR